MSSEERPTDEVPPDEVPPDELPPDELPPEGADARPHPTDAEGRDPTAEAPESRRSPQRRWTDSSYHPIGFLRWVASMALIFPIRLYQQLISPLFGPVCRFQPTCSEYFIQAVRKYGPLRGAWKGVCRIARCHPLHPGGEDPV